MLHFKITLVKLIYNLKKKIFSNGNDVLILLPKIINLKEINVIFIEYTNI